MVPIVLSAQPINVVKNPIRQTSVSFQFNQDAPLDSVPSSAQLSNYDIYKPISDTYRNYTYYPPTYSPINTGEEISPYQELVIVPTVSTLETFLRETKRFPDLKNKYKGDWNSYVDIAAKYLAKNKSDVMIGKKPAMKFFQEDWDLLRRHAYENAVEEKERLVKDSIESRERFISDSIFNRELFVRDSTVARNKYFEDSINHRKQFVDDSLYRANFRKQNNYDNVVFDGPHGDPIQCYRKGKLIEERVYKMIDDKKELWKQVKNGEVVYAHYSFSRIEYLRPSVYRDGSASDLSINRIFHHIHYYKYHYDPNWEEEINEYTYLTLQGDEYIAEKDGKTLLSFSVDQFGRRIQEVIYDDNLPIYFNVLSWYSNGKMESVKTYRVLSYDQGEIQGQLELSCNFFSDGLLRSAYQYCKGNNGKYVLRRSVESHPTWGGYTGKLYDLDGNYERTIDWKVSFSAPDPTMDIVID